MTFTGTTWVFNREYYNTSETEYAAKLDNKIIDVSFTDIYGDQYVGFMYRTNNIITYYTTGGSVMAARWGEFESLDYAIVTFTSEPSYSDEYGGGGDIIQSIGGGATIQSVSQPLSTRNGESSDVIAAFEEFMTNNATRIDNLSLDGTTWVFSPWPYLYDDITGTVSTVPVSFTDADGYAYSAIDYKVFVDDYHYVIDYLYGSPVQRKTVCDYNNTWYSNGSRKITFTSDIDSNFDSQSSALFIGWLQHNAKPAGDLQLDGTTWVFNRYINMLSDYMHNYGLVAPFTDFFGNEYDGMYFENMGICYYNMSSELYPRVYEIDDYNGKHTGWLSYDYRAITFVGDPIVNESEAVYINEFLSRNARNVDSLSLNGTNWIFGEYLDEYIFGSQIETSVPISLQDHSGDSYDGIDYSLGLGLVSSDPQSVTQAYTYNGTWSDPLYRDITFTSDIDSSFGSASASAFKIWLLLNATSSIDLTGTSWLIYEYPAFIMNVLIEAEIDFHTKSFADGKYILIEPDEMFILYSDGNDYHSAYNYDWEGPLENFIQFDSDVKTGGYSLGESLSAKAALLDWLRLNSSSNNEDYTEYKTDAVELGAIADAIREKLYMWNPDENGMNLMLTYPDGFVSSILDIETPMLSFITITPTESRQTFAPPDGYNGFAYVTVSSISNKYIGTAVSSIASSTWTPGVLNKYISSRYYLNGSQTIKGDINLISSNIKSGVSIFGVMGTYAADASFERALIERDTTVLRSSYYNQSVTKVASYAFAQCSNLNYVDLPSCSNVNQFAFFGCTGLSGFNLPRCSYIGTNAFSGCSSLTSADLPYCRGVYDSAFAGCYSLGYISLPICSQIGSYAFQACRALSYADLPSCRGLYTGVFQNCSNLAFVSLPSCSMVMSSAFYYCSNLSSVYLPKCEIMYSAFNSSCKISYIDLPSCVALYGTFSGVSTLQAISIPACETIGTYTFYRCSGLSSIYAPACKNVSASAFAYCTNLETAIIPEVLDVAYMAFGGCTKLRSVYIPKCSSAYYAFSGCSSLTSAYLQKCSSTYYAFYGCTSLSDVCLPMATSIGAGTFYYCSGLQRISLPSATYIASAFSGCRTLTSFYLPGSVFASIQYASMAFVSTPISTYTAYTDGVYGSIFVPSSMYSTYVGSTGLGWYAFSSRFASIPVTTIQFSASGSYFIADKCETMISAMQNWDAIRCVLGDTGISFEMSYIDKEDIPAIQNGTMQKKTDITEQYGAQADAFIAVDDYNAGEEGTLVANILENDDYFVDVTFTGMYGQYNSDYYEYEAAHDGQALAQALRDGRKVVVRLRGAIGNLIETHELPSTASPSQIEAGTYASVWITLPETSSTYYYGIKFEYSNGIFRATKQEHEINSQ